MKAQPVLKWAHLNVTEKISKARSIVTAMTGNTNFSSPNPAPNPSLASISAAADALEKAQTDVDDNGGGRKWTNIRDNRETDLDPLMSQLLKYVDNVANGDSEIILSAAFDLKKPPVHKTKTTEKA